MGASATAREAVVRARRGEGGRAECHSRSRATRIRFRFNPNTPHAWSQEYGLGLARN